MFIRAEVPHELVKSCSDFYKYHSDSLLSTWLFSWRVVELGCSYFEWSNLFSSYCLEILYVIFHSFWCYYFAVWARALLSYSPTTRTYSTHVPLNWCFQPTFESGVGLHITLCQSSLKDLIHFLTLSAVPHISFISRPDIFQSVTKIFQTLSICSFLVGMNLITVSWLPNNDLSQLNIKEKWENKYGKANALTYNNVIRFHQKVKSIYLDHHSKYVHQLYMSRG